MTRSRSLLAAAATLYVIAWFLPVAKGGTTLANGGLPGWEALKVSLSPLWDSGARESWWRATLSVISGLSNALFVSILFRRWSAARVTRALRQSAILAVPLNLHWLALWQPRSELYAGYYAWVLSFALLASALNVTNRPTD